MRFKNYINGFSKRNRIYSEEDLYKMMLEELLDNEESILSQNSMIGIPTNYELEESPNTEWIEKFVNSEGNSDRGYWQSILKPDFVPDMNNYSQNKMNELDDYLKELKEIPFGNELNSQDELMPEEDVLEDEEETPQLEGRVEKMMQELPTQYWDKDGKIHNVGEEGEISLRDKFLDWTIRNDLAKKIFPAASNIYTDAVTDFSRARNNKNVELLEDQSTLDDETKQILRQYGVKDDEKGVLYKIDSEMSKKFGNSPELKEFFKKNKKQIEEGNLKHANVNFDYKKNPFNLNNIDRYGSIQHANIVNPSIDGNSKRATIVDRTDYEKRNEDYPYIPAMYNNLGYDMQENGNLENYYTIIQIQQNPTLKEKFEEWLKKRRKR
ncbi:MAG: hypothetical protein MJ231_00010 [bacterium]|nr:hypothetical protein [bacterium]